MKPERREPDYVLYVTFGKSGGTKHLWGGVSSICNLAFPDFEKGNVTFTRSATKHRAVYHLYTWDDIVDDTHFRRICRNCLGLKVLCKDYRARVEAVLDEAPEFQTLCSSFQQNVLTNLGADSRKLEQSRPEPTARVVTQLVLSGESVDLIIYEWLANRGLRVPPGLLKRQEDGGRVIKTDGLNAFLGMLKGGT